MATKPSVQTVAANFHSGEKAKITSPQEMCFS